METSKRVLIRGGELRHNPGWYKIDGRIEGEADSWCAVRKPDGTWWWVAATHIFPPGGGDVRIDLGEQVKETKTLAQLDEHYIDLLQKLEERMKEGEHVRVIRTGTMGTIKGFGNVPGVPKMINVAYDGGGGCNHMPEELELVKDGFTPK